MLPYENATSGKAATEEIRRIVQGFGATSFGVMDDFAAGTVMVQFVWRDRRVSITASAKGYAAAWLREHPYKPRYHGALVDYERRALQQGQLAVYSILRDWIKGQITAIAVGMLSFEGAFLGQILLPSGRTVLQEIEDKGILRIEHHAA